MESYRFISKSIVAQVTDILPKVILEDGTAYMFQQKSSSTLTKLPYKTREIKRLTDLSVNLSTKVLLNRIDKNSEVNINTAKNNALIESPNYISSQGSSSRESATPHWTFNSRRSEFFKTVTPLQPINANTIKNEIDTICDVEQHLAKISPFMEYLAIKEKERQAKEQLKKTCRRFIMPMIVL